MVPLVWVVVCVGLGESSWVLLLKPPRLLLVPLLSVVEVVVLSMALLPLLSACVPLALLPVLL